MSIVAEAGPRWCQGHALWAQGSLGYPASQDSFLTTDQRGKLAVS